MARFASLLLDAPDQRDASVIAFAAAHHDLGIWTDGDWNYLEASRTLARECASTSTVKAFIEAVDLMILEHHKLRAYVGPWERLVEPFRCGDLVDLTRGMITYGLSTAQIRTAQSDFPNEGFHRALAVTALGGIVRRPWAPFPMVRL